MPRASLGVAMLGTMPIPRCRHEAINHGTDGAAMSDGHDAPGGFESFMVAFLPMRLWSFFLAFFGLTGVVLDGLGLVWSSVVAVLLALVMGPATGFGAVWVMRRVRAATPTAQRPRRTT